MIWDLYIGKVAECVVDVVGICGAVFVGFYVLVLDGVVGYPSWAAPYYHGDMILAGLRCGGNAA